MRPQLCRLPAGAVSLRAGGSQVRRRPGWLRPREARFSRILASRSNRRRFLPLAGRRPTGASSCSPTTTAMSFKRLIDFTARDRHPQPLSRTGREASTKPPGGRARRDSAPTARKTPLQMGKQAFREPVLGPARREHAAHESLIRRPMLAEVPLAGLSSTFFLWQCGEPGFQPACGDHE